ncbi:MAG: putative signal transducing protein [Acidobacteriota bacterium]
MHCPRCHAEYRPGFTRCADCDVPLAQDAPDEGGGHRHGRWTRLCSVSTDTEATLLQGYLESAGIPCSIESLVFHAEPVNFGPLARVRLYVLDEHLEEARELLRQGDDMPEAVNPPARR